MIANQISVDIPIKYVLRGLGAIAVLLVAASIAGSWLAYYGGHDWMFGFAPKVNLDQEANLPTYYSSMLLLLCSVLLAIIALEARRSSQQFVRRWCGLSAIFALMSVEEIVGFHELSTAPLRKAFDLTGIFYFAWVIPGAFVVALFAAVYFPLLRHLPKRTRIHIAIAGCVFVGGALGVEMMGGYYSYHYGEFTFTYSLITAAEETLEMAGVILFIRALLDIMESRMRTIQFKIVG